MSSHVAQQTSSSTSPESLCQDMLALLQRFKHLVALLAETYGLTPIQLWTLQTIHNGSDSMGKVAHALHCDASNVTGLVDRLVSLGLLERHEDPTDRRVKTLRITSKGSSILNELTTKLPDLLGCQALDTVELSQLHALLTKLTDASQADGCFMKQ